MSRTLTAEAIALPNVLTNFDPAAGLKESVQPVGLDVALAPAVEASTTATPRLKTIAGGCGPLACAGCPFAQQCRGESTESILKTSTTSESDTKNPETTVKPRVVEESVAPATRTPESTPLKSEKPAPVPAIKAPEPKPAVIKPAPAVAQRQPERTPSPIPIRHAAAEQPAKVEAAPVSVVMSEQPKAGTAPVKPASVAKIVSVVEVQSSAPEATTLPQPVAAQETATRIMTAAEHHHKPVAETEHVLDVVAIQANQEMVAAQLLASPDGHVITEHTVATTGTLSKDLSPEAAIVPKTQAASPKARAHTATASSPAGRANTPHEARPAATTEEVASKTQATAIARTTRAANKKTTPELAAHQTTAPIAEKLVAKLTSGEVASIGAKIDKLLAKIERHENDARTTASASRQERLIVATLEDLSELLDIEPEELERTLQVASEKGEAQIVQLVELLTGLQQLTQGNASHHEIDRLLSQSFLHKALGSPWDGAQQSDDQPHRIWSLGILVMSSILLRYSRQNQNSLIPAQL